AADSSIPRLSRCPRAFFSGGHYLTGLAAWASLYLRLLSCHCWGWAACSFSRPNHPALRLTSLLRECKRRPSCCGESMWPLQLLSLYCSGCTLQWTGLRLSTTLLPL